MPAKLFRPLLESGGPLILVFFGIVTSIENKFQLIVAIMFKAKNTGKVDVKLMQMTEFCFGVLLDFFCGIIGKTQRIASKQILDLYKINEVL